MLNIKRRLGESLYVEGLRLTVLELSDGAAQIGLPTEPPVSVRLYNGDVLHVGRDVVVKNVIASKGRVKLGVTGPDGMRVRRGELPPRDDESSGKKARARYNHNQ